MDALLGTSHGVRSSLPLDVLAGLTLLGAVPFLLVMTTSFVRIVVDQDGAGTAYAVLAAHMGAGEPQLVAQAVDQRHARLDLDSDVFSIDFEGHRHGDPISVRRLSLPPLGGG